MSLFCNEAILFASVHSDQEHIPSPTAQLSALVVSHLCTIAEAVAGKRGLQESKATHNVRVVSWICHLLVLSARWLRRFNFLCGIIRMGWNFQLFRGHRQRQGKRRLQHFLSYSAAPDVPCTERGLTTMLHLNSGLFGVVLVLAMATDCYAKSWRGITPLKSTRSDVERLFGKPNDLGRYEIENEHAYIFYSAGPCNGDYQNLSKQKCECLVEKDTVVRIAVTLDRHVVLPAVDKAKFSRAPLRSNTPMSTYSNLVDGIVYMVDDSNQTLTAIDYWPSAADCTQVVASHAAKLQRNSGRVFDRYIQPETTLKEF